MADNTVDYMKGQIEALNLVVNHLLSWHSVELIITSNTLARPIQEGPQDGSSPAYREGFDDGVKAITGNYYQTVTTRTKRR